MTPYARPAALALTAFLFALTGCGTGGSTATQPVAPPAVPAATLSASSLAFTSNLGGPAAPAQTVTLSNTGNTALGVSGMSLSSTAFTQTSTCGPTLAVSTSCTITLNFASASPGSYPATYTVTDSAGTQTIALTGLETAPAIILSASTLTFTTPAESSSAPQTLTITNTGNGSLTAPVIYIGGANSKSFLQGANTCKADLAPAATCTVTYALTAFLAQSYAAALTIVTNLPQQSTVVLNGTGTGTITLNTSNAADWIINNGAVTLDFDPAQFHIFAIHLAGDSNNLVDTTNISSRDGKPQGFYMGNQNFGTGTLYTGSKQVGNQYLDFWVGQTSSATNFATYEEHFIVTANDPGFHSYFVLNHSPTDIAGFTSLILWQFRTSLSLFTHSYGVDVGLNLLGPSDTPIPSPYNQQLNDPGRVAQNAVVDLHGITDTATAAFIASKGRNFYTKYDYSTYEYLHKEQGVYGPQYGTWCVLPRGESIAGGPTKQNVDTLNQIIQQEMTGDHYVGTLNYTPPQGVQTTKLWGPTYWHFNQFTPTVTTPAALYQEAQTWLPYFDSLYDIDTPLATSAYVPSTGRGSVAATIANGGSTTPNTAWTVLSDPATNFQISGAGYNYWANNLNGTASIKGVVPGAYRLSHYVLGQWGEHREDGLIVTANTVSADTGTFTPENFGTAAAIWTIGTPDRSAHEFLHGHDAAGNDFRNYYGQFDFWNEFAPTLGQQTYYATAVGSTPATNDPNAINYVQWGPFNPGLFAGIYNAADDTTDGYKYIVPAYVGAANVATKTPPPLAVHFTTTAAQQAQGTQAVVSIALAGVYGSVIASLNGHQLIWHYINSSDPMIRSGLSGYYQWLVLDWPTTYLNAPGTDNILTFGTSQIGWMPDAFRMEITNSTGDPALTNWHDYEYVNATKYTPANDAIPNN